MITILGEFYLIVFSKWNFEMGSHLEADNIIQWLHYASFTVLFTKMTLEQLPIINTCYYFWVPRVVVVLRFDCTYSQTWANDHLRIVTTWLQRPPFWIPNLDFYNIIYLWTTTTFPQRPQIWGPQGLSLYTCLTVI